MAVGDTGVGGPGAVVLTSVDGVNWYRVPHNEAIFGGEANLSMDSVTAARPGLVAVGSGGPGRGSATVWLATPGQDR